MIVIIEFVGTMRRVSGAKKYNISLEEKATMLTLIRKLKEEFLTGKELDQSNMLFLVNGKEIGVLKGFQTELRTNDIVTLIPISHGG